MGQFTIHNISISPLIIGLIVFILWIALLHAVKKIIFVRIQKIAQKTQTQLDDAFIGALNLPLNLIILATGLIILQKISPSGNDQQLAHIFSGILKTVAIIAIFLFFDKFSKSLVEMYSQKIEILRCSKNVVKSTIRIVMIALGLLIILDSFGISITPILASLGIGSLAIALALQPTLENFFSGIQLITDKPIQIGQFIRLESGEEGFVEKIGWRSSWIKMLPHNMIIIPNKILANSRILNYHYPDKETTLTVEVGVHYNSNLSHVEKITQEAAKDILKTIPGGVPAFEPFVRFHTFNNSSIDMTVILRVKEFTDAALVKHEFIKHLHKRYAQEGIVIPYPIQAINTEQEKSQNA